MTSLKQWQSHLAALYPNVGKTPDYMMTHLYTSCSDIGRTLLRGEGASRRDHAVLSSISWMIALANHFQLDYEHAIVSRFPGCCPYCLGRPCECDMTERRARHRERILSPAETEEERGFKFQAVRSGGSKIDFNWVTNQLRAIYPGNRILLTKGGGGYVTGKLLEEGGELHRAYSEVLLSGGVKSRISTELADLTAWLISCWDITGSGKSLDAEFASEFGRVCPACNNNPCTCRNYSITPGQEELISQIAADLHSLEAEVGIEEDVQKGIELATEAAINPSPEKKKTLVEHVTRLSMILKASDEGVGSASGIVVKLVRGANALAEMIN